MTSSDSPENSSAPQPSLATNLPKPSELQREWQEILRALHPHNQDFLRGWQALLRAEQQYWLQRLLSAPSNDDRMKAMGVLEHLQGWIYINPNTNRADTHDQYTALGNSIVNKGNGTVPPGESEATYSTPDSGEDY